MGKKLIHLVIGVLIVCIILLCLNNMLINKFKKENIHNYSFKKNEFKESNKEQICKYIKKVKEDMNIINKNWNIVKEYCNVKTWLTDDNESKIELAFKEIKMKWNEISKLEVPNNDDTKALQEKLMNCKDIQTHAISLAIEAMNTSNFQLIIESIDILIDSNKFITNNICPLITKIENSCKQKTSSGF
ncbi:hypothetical protein [Clostridium tarantellae]|uniref:Uncharacterized protein n=1 Tax=Clostridium tarantellae TaxID=39493 RepID=A0A6I1MNW6_9CLOT|nr:hypothetical protein [Clostridium tarantellae]MPQ44744.1 hypothetical protein [Clostridium tarantellae]